MQDLLKTIISKYPLIKYIGNCRMWTKHFKNIILDCGIKLDITWEMLLSVSHLQKNKTHQIRFKDFHQTGEGRA